jgi:hypothetical protein
VFGLGLGIEYRFSLRVRVRVRAIYGTGLGNKVRVGNEGRFLETFGAGTAAVISSVKAIRYQGKVRIGTRFRGMVRV